MKRVDKSGISKVMAIPSKEVLNYSSKKSFHSGHNEIRNLFESIQKYAEYVDRNWVERDESYMQIVACGVVRCGHKMFCIRRSQRSNRDALRLRWTVMFGGHVDRFDERTSEPIRNCLYRELDEELGISPKATPSVIGFVTDPETEVGRLHLGIVFDVEIDSDEIQLAAKHDRDEFVHQNRNYSVKMKDVTQIRELADNFDPWSKIFLSSPVALEMLGSVKDVYTQLPLDLSW